MNANDPRRKPFNAYIRQCADLMRLQAWDIEVGDREPESDELVHIVLWELWSVVDDGKWRGNLSLDQYAATHDRGIHALEAATEFLARLIAPSLPLPPRVWGTPTPDTTTGNGTAPAGVLDEQMAEVSHA